MATSLQSVEYVVDAGIAQIQLARPAASNAIDRGLAGSFHTAVSMAADDPDVRVIVLSGQGKNFCAGGDVTGMATATDTATFVEDLANAVHRTLVRLDSLPIPVVAAVNGSAAGAGLGLVLASDFVVAGASSKFVSAYSAVGLTPDCGVSALLPKVVGLRRASRMLLQAKTLRSDEALEWGLITDVVDDDEVLVRALEIAKELASKAYPAIGQTRRLVRSSGARSYESHLRDEASTISSASNSDFAVAAIARFAR
ncbi:Enoyl-CoA hydratase [Rhodococcus wratislaviensis]|uniref:Enoyl-CoA hydratase n=1 Tax=Rhodococcus wratislaviensis TaxID=44752 RepID=A0A402CKB2_RHOWR|nr:enoyl-CoA hydratase/isomerase family protein [Rhodococcus wratislaviensis]GCE44054.1 Enoyl-CoA hydratase [Rhodococcus wratislaviensis]